MSITKPVAVISDLRHNGTGTIANIDFVLQCNVLLGDGGIAVWIN